MSGDKARERTSLGKITLDGTVRIIAVERADADTIRLHCTLVIPEDRHSAYADEKGTTFYTNVWKECGPGLRYSDAAFDDIERQLRKLVGS